MDIKSNIELPASMRLGVDQLDRQHQRLIEQLNRLRKRQDVPINSEVVGEVSYLMGSSLLEHFRAEEAFMSQTCMPREMFEEHRKEHDRIIHGYVEFQEQMLSSPHMKVGEILSTVENWITTHILDFDLQIRGYI
jgi:hemerythrin